MQLHASKSSPRKALFSLVQEQSQHQPKDSFREEHINVSNLFEINESQVKVTVYSLPVSPPQSKSPGIPPENHESSFY
jgi:hypothetical protein